MPDILSSGPNRVAVYQDPNALPAQVKVEGLPPTTVLITGLEYGQETNQQCQYTLGDEIYVYVFGDLMGAVTVKGIALPSLCDKPEANGLKNLVAFYKTYRASHNPNPMKVQVASKGEGDNGEPIQGFLTKMNIESQGDGRNPISFVNPWSIVINTLPGK